MGSSACLFSESSGIRVVWGGYGRCSLNCKHCAVPKENYENPALEKYGPVLDDMVLSGVDTIYLSGGEPLLWKDVFGFIKLAKGKGITVTLGTNGIELRQNSADMLLEAGIDKVFLSLDSHKEEVHNALRGKDVFRRALKGLELLKERGIYTRIDCILWKENYGDMEAFVNFCRGNGADEIVFAWPLSIGNAATNPEIAIPESEYLEVGKRLKDLKEGYSKEMKSSYHRFGGFGPECKSCSGGRKIFYIDWRGRLSPCFWASVVEPKLFTEGNSFEEKFSSLEENSVIKDFVRLEEKRKESFGPGCPAICKIFNDSFYSKDPLLSVL